VQKGVPILEVSRLMGHSSVTITEQHYAALSNQSARAAISMLDVLNNPNLDSLEAGNTSKTGLPPDEK